MPTFTSLLDEALEAWQYTREGVIREIRNLPETALTVRPAPGARSTAEIAVHIAESGLMMAGELSRPDGDFQRQTFPEFMKEYAKGVKPTSKQRQLLQLLTRTHQSGAKRLRAVGDLHMLQLITRFDGKQGSRLTWMHHGISHEEYHRGQLALCARVAGRVPALTRLIHGA
jgi:uncharacterized damage-inducible protein DinB